MFIYEINYIYIYIYTYDACDVLLRNLKEMLKQLVAHLSLSKGNENTLFPNTNHEQIHEGIHVASCIKLVSIMIEYHNNM